MTVSLTVADSPGGERLRVRGAARHDAEGGGAWLLFGASDPEGELCSTASRGSRARHGTATVNTNGSFGYVPNSSYTGRDSFTYHGERRRRWLTWRR